MKKILIIDDSKLTMAYIVRFLEDEYDVISAITAKEGIEILKNHHPDCIVSDLIMPEMDGFQFLEYLREKNISIPTIIISSDISDTDREKCLSLDAFAVLSKPVKGKELKNAVKKAIEGQDLTTSFL